MHSVFKDKQDGLSKPPCRAGDGWTHRGEVMLWLEGKEQQGCFLGCWGRGPGREEIIPYLMHEMGAEEGCSLGRWGRGPVITCHTPGIAASPCGNRTGGGHCCACHTPGIASSPCGRGHCTDPHGSWTGGGNYCAFHTSQIYTTRTPHTRGWSP